MCKFTLRKGAKDVKTGACSLPRKRALRRSGKGGVTLKKISMSDGFQKTFLTAW